MAADGIRQGGISLAPSCAASPFTLPRGRGGGFAIDLAKPDKQGPYLGKFPAGRAARNRGFAQHQAKPQNLASLMVF